MNEELLRKAQAALAIEDIYLKRSQAVTHPSFEPKIARKEELALQHKLSPRSWSHLSVDIEGGGSIDIMRFEMDAALRLVDPSATADELKGAEGTEQIKVVMSASFVAEYRVKSDISEQAAEEFGKYNVGYHVWPYWREYVQNMCARMLLPTIILPMYRRPLPIEPKSKEEPAQQLKHSE